MFPKIYVLLLVYFAKTDNSMTYASATFETLMTGLSNLSFRVSISFCKNSIDEVALDSADGDILPPATPSCKCLLGCITDL